MPYQNMQSIRVIPWDQQASWVVPAVKNLSANAGDVKRNGFDLWVGKIPWKRAWQPTVILAWRIP